MVRMYEGWHLINVSTKALAEVRILSPAVGGSFRLSWSTSWGNKLCTKRFWLTWNRFSRPLSSWSLFLSVMPSTVYDTSPA